ncbi:MAG: hypothetical protein JSW64_00570 [Candidatus Zixiibacteriota bacterium]|nr:MAG: hypothetical protein JSW64_00570 [candidate division Zixibacteria bacterium]
MRKAFSIFCLVLALSVIESFAQGPESFDDAKNLAVSQGKPVLMEFLRPG